MSHFFVSKWKMCRLISILYLYQKQHLLWTIQKNPCTLNSKESFMNPSASYSSTELPKKKIVSRYYNMLPFVLFWSISVSQNPDHEPISNPTFSTTDHGPEFVHTICGNKGKIKLVGGRLVHMGEKLFPWSWGWPLAFNCNQEDRHSFFPYRPPVW